MTDEQLAAIDRACAQKVMGFANSVFQNDWLSFPEQKYACSQEDWQPSRNIAQAWQVLEKIDHPTLIRKHMDGYWARIMKIDRDVFAAAETAPLAITLACLKAISWVAEE